MRTPVFEDRLEPVGILAGALLVLIALGTLIGMPWTTDDSALVSLLQILGVPALLALGGGLAWLSLVRE